jgi:hypothetical protein
MYALGASYAPAASPKTTGWGAIAPLFPGVACDSTKEQPRSYTQYIESAVKVNGAWTLEQTVTTGVAVPLRAIGPPGWKLSLWALGAAGAAVVGSSSTVKLGTAFGGFVRRPFNTGKLSALLGFEDVNNTKQALAALVF